jgi:A/G-specific adenine glycosylase
MQAAVDLAPRLLAWFDTHGRKNLPWQIDATAYRVWVSEIMLQQTQVATVISYYTRFMARFPDVHALVDAPIDEVLHLWTGLGYYARARNLHRAAGIVVSDYAGELPRTIEELQSLPGVGRSTAAAILALAHGERHAILDGNVKRVLARVFGIEGDPGAANTVARFWQHAEVCTPHTRLAEYTQAIMDLGATVCTRARPVCTVCPMVGMCVAARDGRQAELPQRKVRRARKSRSAVLLIATSADAVYVERRVASGIWGGLWSPPEFADDAAALDWCRSEIGELRGAPAKLAPIDHAFTHFDLRLYPLRVECEPRPAVHEKAALWYTLRTPPRVGLPQPIRVLLEQLAQEK